MDSQPLSHILNKFPVVRALVVGDVYLDENVHALMTGVSLEAPIPVLEVRERRYNPGAAGNVACNLAALGGKTRIVGVVGNDPNATILRNEFAAQGVDVSGLVVNPGAPTNTYGKWRAGGYNAPEQEVMRTDTPRPSFIDSAIEDQVISAIESVAQDVDVIVVADQVSSVATRRVLDAVVRIAKPHGLITVGDSRERIGEFAGFSLVAPNDREAGVGMDMPAEDDAQIDAAAEALLQLVKAALITRGPLGIQGYGKKERFLSPSLASEVRDVTGAGDTVTAAAALSMAAGATLEQAAHIANAAAAVAVAENGVVAVGIEAVRRRLAGESQNSRVVSAEALEAIVRDAQSHGQRVVWTNGCFDILHAGHVTYLQRAAREGNVLVVGLNSDASVRAVKGPERPIVPEHERALIIAELKCVNYVTVFDEASPLGLLTQLQPDVYAKGGDYTIDTIDQTERRAVESYGGRIALIDGVEGRSTTNLVTRLDSEYDG